MPGDPVGRLVADDADLVGRLRAPGLERLGVVGFKGAFTHTPFAEFEEFEARTPGAVDRRGDSPTGDVAFLRVDGTRYRLEIVRPPEAA